MTVFDMTKEDFDKVPDRGGWSRDIGEFSSLVIIPMDYAHDSGWMCMDFPDVPTYLTLMELADLEISESENCQAALSRRDGALTVCLADICGCLNVLAVDILILLGATMRTRPTQTESGR